MIEVRTPAGAHVPRFAVNREAGDVAWMSAAACAGRDDLPWTADLDALDVDTRSWAVGEMAAVCAGCPVFAECWAYGAATTVTAGFWAGTPHDLPTPATRTRVATRGKAVRGRNAG